MPLPDFERVARDFVQAGWRAERLGEALWHYLPPASGEAPRLRLLLSAGVHGDETAPIEMLARLLPAWAASARSLAVELAVAIGNPDAVAAGRRYLRRDLNRLFGADGVPAGWGAEGRRAEQLRRALAPVLGRRTRAPVVHLDLHTTIRPSLKPTFAMVPGDDPQAPLVHWLGRAGLHAVVLNPGPGVTFSAFTAGLGAEACTIELGAVARFGENDPGAFAGFEAALDALVRDPDASWPGPAAGPTASEVYRVTREILRSSERFELLVSGTSPNFARLEPGQLVARDRLDLVHALREGECILFPNPAVAIGLRAGLLVAPADAS